MKRKATIEQNGLPSFSNSTMVEHTSDAMDDCFPLSVKSVEEIINYKFTDKSLIEAALTHPSYCDAPSYQRLEFVGDAALGLAISNFLFVSYPDHDPGQLSLIRSANISTEKFARIAVQRGLFKFVRHKAPALQEKVKEFSLAIKEEGDENRSFGGGSAKAPKVLADIVESIAAAVYVDCNFDLHFLWQCFSPLLEPLVTHHNLILQPVTLLHEICQKHGKDVQRKHKKDGEINETSIIVDGILLGKARSENKEISKLNAARQALNKLFESLPTKETQSMPNEVGEDDGMSVISRAKQKLFRFCTKKHWSKPTYSVVNEEGPSHEKKFTCSVQIETSEEVFTINGDVNAKLKNAQNSAASKMINFLKDTKHGAGLLDKSSLWKQRLKL